MKHRTIQVSFDLDVAEAARPVLTALKMPADPGGIETAAWTTHEWLHFINTLPAGLPETDLAALDQRFNLSGSQNAEIANACFLKAIPAGYEPAFAPLDAFLIRVGRGKFIYRLYQSLADNGRKDWALSIYARTRPGYHPIAQRRIDGILAE